MNPSKNRRKRKTPKTPNEPNYREDIKAKM